MNIHEHQAKGLLRKFGVSVPDGYPAFTVEEAVKNAKKLPGPVSVSYTHLTLPTICSV